MPSTMNRLRVLKLGWEFPPLINGGLGIACLGLPQALARHINDLLTDAAHRARVIEHAIAASIWDTAAKVMKIYDELGSQFAFKQFSHKPNARRLLILSSPPA